MSFLHFRGLVLGTSSHCSKQLKLIRLKGETCKQDLGIQSLQWELVHILIQVASTSW